MLNLAWALKRKNVKNALFGPLNDRLLMKRFYWEKVIFSWKKLVDLIKLRNLTIITNIMKFTEKNSSQTYESAEK